jgi:hypothetical protein
MRRGRLRRNRSPRRVGTFLVTTVGLHHHLESKDECCTEPPEGSSAVDVARDTSEPTGRR